jgi:hypothetical protein
MPLGERILWSAAGLVRDHQKAAVAGSRSSARFRRRPTWRRPPIARGDAGRLPRGDGFNVYAPTGGSCGICSLSLTSMPTVYRRSGLTSRAFPLATDREEPVDAVPVPSPNRRSAVLRVGSAAILSPVCSVRTCLRRDDPDLSIGASYGETLEQFAAEAAAVTRR